MKFIEFVKGQKYAPANAEISDTHETFTDCGILLEDYEVVIDIDHLSRDQINGLIKEFDIKTQMVWTTRGIHFYFKKPTTFKKAKNGMCPMGFEIETKTSGNTPNGVTFKQYGEVRKMENEGILQELPWYFWSYKKYSSMEGFGEGEGRNNALFGLRCKLSGHEDTYMILNYVNKYMFSEPISERELVSIMRDMSLTDKDTSEFAIAEEIINTFKCKNYLGSIWWYENGRYKSVIGNDIAFKKLIYSRCQGKKTTYVEEIMKEIYILSKFEEIRSFPIKFKNGILKDGKFTEVEYEEFTPYMIDVNYDKDAQVNQDVENYLNQLTDGEPEYRRLLEEVIGYPLVTDPEKIRSIGKFFIFRGNGANGKGTLLQIMLKIYTAQNCTSLSIKNLMDERYAVTMIGKLVNLGDDVQPEAINNDQMKMIKNITTADEISMRRLYQQSEMVKLTTKLIFTTNSDIKTFEKGYAYKRRVLWLPMFNTIDKPDPNFISKMTSDHALCYWTRLMVEGYMRIYKNNKMTSSPKVDEYNEQYHRDNNYMSEFLDSLDIDQDVINSTGKDLQRLYNEYNDDDTKPYKPKLLNDVLREMGIGLGVKKIDGRPKKCYLKQSETDQDLFGVSKKKR